MTRKWHDRLGRWLILALFLIEIPRYANALPDPGDVGALVAVGMGVLLAGSAFYCIETWGMLKRRAGSPPARLGWLARMSLVQIVLAPAIMTPPMVAQQLGVDVTGWIEQPLANPGLLAWTFLVTLAPVMVGGMVAFARSLQYSSSELKGSRVGQGEARVDQDMVKLRAEVKRVEAIAEKEQSRAIKAESRVGELEASLEKAEARATEAEVKRFADFARADELRARVVELEASLTCQYCGQVFDSPQGRASHERACKVRVDGRDMEPAGNGKGEDV